MSKSSKNQAESATDTEQPRAQMGLVNIDAVRALIEHVGTSERQIIELQQKVATLTSALQAVALTARIVA